MCSAAGDRTPERRRGELRSLVRPWAASPASVMEDSAVLARPGYQLCG